MGHESNEIEKDDNFLMPSRFQTKNLDGCMICKGVNIVGKKFAYNVARKCVVIVHRRSQGSSMLIKNVIEERQLLRHSH
jgi:hypothetical protein